MKIPSKIAILLLMLFNVVMAFAETTPPSPTGKSAAANAVPPPDEVPINENLLVLFILGSVLGMYVIYRHRSNRKASV